MTPSPAAGHRTASASDFDTAPLSWVIGEIRDTLTRTGSALQAALSAQDGGDADASAALLRQAKGQLHQAHGALHMIDVDGVVSVTAAIEDLFERVVAGTLRLDAALVQTMAAAADAVTGYLEELLAGAVQQPVRLFPYYEALQKVRGAERIHPADLFFPDLEARSLPPLAPAVTQPTAPTCDYIAVRKRFEKGLLPFLKPGADSPARQQGASDMSLAIAEVEATQDNPQARAFWWVVRGFAEAVAAGEIAGELIVKQLFARINLQIRRLAEGSTSLTDGVLRDALFFIARVAQPSASLQPIRAAYALDGQVPADFERRRYVPVDAVALAAARAGLVQVKNLWNRIATGDQDAAAGFESGMRALSEAGAGLGALPLAKLLRELNGIARAAANGRPGDQLGLEMAGSLLFVENALGHIGHLPEDFAGQADALTARLLSIVAGEEPAAATPWLDDMSRQAQQRDTIGTLTGELQVNLRQVEKLLDAYFAAPTDNASLATVDTLLHQVGGALAVLDQDQGVRAVEHTRATLRGFALAAPDADDAPAQFHQVARNIGALGFFIETLQLPGGSQHQRGWFDAASGLFHSGGAPASSTLPAPAEADADAVAASAPPAVDGNATAGSTAALTPAPGALQTLFPASVAEQPAALLPTVEHDLALHQQQATMLAQELLADSNNDDLRDQLGHALRQVRRDANLIDHPVANEHAGTALARLAALGPKPSPGQLADLLGLTMPTAEPAMPVAVVAALAAPDTAAGIDAELLEIFLSEADDVLQTVATTMPLAKAAPHDQQHLTTLRRAFHTLKGSGRMVGLDAFGAAAWGIEQTVNLRLAENLGGDAAVFGLLDLAASELGAWVAELQRNGYSDRSPDALVAAAEHVRAGTTNADEVAAEAHAPDSGSATTPRADPAETIEAVEVTAATDGTDDTDITEVAEVTEAIELTVVSEATELPDASPPVRPVLAPGAAVLEFPTLQAPAPARNDSVRQIGDLEIGVALHNIYLAESDELLRVLAQDFDEWRHEPERAVATAAVHAAHSLAGTSATVGFTPLQQVAQVLEAVLQQLARAPVMLLAEERDTLERTLERVRCMLQLFALAEMPATEPPLVAALNALKLSLSERAMALPPDVPAVPTENAELDAQALLGPGRPLQIRDELDADLMPVFIEEASDMLPQIGQLLRTWQQRPGEGTAPQALLRLLHTVKGSARMAGAMRLGQHMHEMESRIEQVAHMRQPSTFVMDDLLARHDAGLQMFDALQALPATAATTTAATTTTSASSVPVAVHPGSSTAAALSSEQGTDTPAAAGTGVTVGRGAIGDTGEIGNIGDASDAGTTLDSGVVATGATTAGLLPNGMPERRRAPRQPQETVKVASVPVPIPLVRVRADILDRLVNQAGEVSISRSRLETELGTMRASLAELTDNVARLRTQLREVEMQAESQIENQTAQPADAPQRQFDPLEFDRFTRLQELTRMMAETVNDVGSVEQAMTRSLDSASADLTLQARLTRELQQDLMGVRMVQFASITERLYRVTRQSAKELDKRVNLDIRGSAVEVDRSVLEKMAGPFEHLLRNAIVHGIESRAARLAAGKSEVGELLVEVRQEGNEVVIQFSDDGHGLDLQRIRSKAIQTGLLGAEGVVSDAELTDLIFHPGFSTAAQITELAGRGVGMDVVRAEATSLGGRVAIVSMPGQGAQFTVHLPLTLAVTQVVLLTTGGKTYAVPSVLVEQVQQLKSPALAAAYNEGAVMWQSQRVPMVYLASLLGEPETSAVAQQYSPLIILKSGNSRIAVHVDEILGNREVVVKNVGPQLARMSGIAGATVLGSGEIVLILNPLALAQRAAQEQGRVAQSAEAGAATLGAIAEFGGSDQATLAVPGLRTQPIVMVVDDSLTVRRVTQRLLSREGYRVVLAKDGVDALEQLQEITPDVMLVDIEMPRMDGFDLTRNVRDDARTRHIPIIMITSRTASKHRNFAFELGVNEYLGKPYQEDLLLASIAGFIAGAPVTL